jgi:hypothetical protein
MLITTPLAQGDHAGRTPFYVAAIEGHAAVITAMREAGQYTPAEWRALITTPLAQGADIGKTVLSAAISKGHTAALMVMREGGDYTPEEWQTLTSPRSLYAGGPSLFATDSKENATPKPEAKSSSEPEEVVINNGAQQSQSSPSKGSK